MFHAHQTEPNQSDPYTSSLYTLTGKKNIACVTGCLPPCHYMTLCQLLSVLIEGQHNALLHIEVRTHRLILSLHFSTVVVACPSWLFGVAVAILLISHCSYERKAALLITRSPLFVAQPAAGAVGGCIASPEAPPGGACLSLLVSPAALSLGSQLIVFLVCSGVAG